MAGLGGCRRNGGVGCTRGGLIAGEPARSVSGSSAAAGRWCGGAPDEEAGAWVPDYRTNGTRTRGT